MSNAATNQPRPFFVIVTATRGVDFVSKNKYRFATADAARAFAAATQTITTAATAAAVTAATLVKSCHIDADVIGDADALALILGATN